MPISQEMMPKFKPFKPRAKNRKHSLAGMFFVGTFLWLCGGFAIGKFVEGKSMVKSADVPQVESVRGAQDFRQDMEQIFLENVFPVEGSIPVRDMDVPDIILTEAHASLLLDADSGIILHHKNGTQRRSIASLTKVMTGMLVMENIVDLDDAVTITEDIYAVPGTVVGCPMTGICNGQRMYPGEQLTARDLMRAMLMSSANDAATALAVHVSGSSEAFVKRMNRRAKELGFKDTHFCTPSGLETTGLEHECYSSAYDIARIAAMALKYDDMWEIMRTPSATITSLDGRRTHALGNTNKILETYPNLVGAKTGFTPLAGRSLLAVAEDRGRHLVAVLLDDPYRWGDVKEMFAWGWSAYRWE